MDVRTKRWLGIGVVAALAGFALWHYVPATQLEAPTAQATAAQSQRSVAAAADQTSSPVARARPAQEGRVRAFEALKQRAKAGDALAQRKLAEAYDACFIVNLDRERFVRGYEQSRGQFTDPAQAHAQEQLVQARLAECDAVDGGAIVPTELIRGWYAQAAENGDLAARAMDGAINHRKKDPAGAASLLTEVLASDDPAAVFAFGNTLGVEYPADVGASADALVNGRLASGAWMVAACRMGYDCEPSGVVMGNMCLFVNQCTGEDYEALVRRTLPSEVDRMELERRVAEILRQIEARSRKGDGA